MIKDISQIIVNSLIGTNKQLTREIQYWFCLTVNMYQYAICLKKRDLVTKKLDTK